MHPFDPRHAWRFVRASPWLSAAVILLIAGGITLTTAAFSVVNAVWLRSLPYPEADRLVVVSELHPRLGHASIVAPAVYTAWRDSPGWSDGVGAFFEQALALGRPGARAERVRGVTVVPALLRLLGATPLLGRSLTTGDAEPGAGAVALVSERFWRTRCSANPAVVGSTVRFDGIDTTIVGVLPYSFKLFNRGFDVFAPLPNVLPADERRSLLVVARLPRGATRESALAALATYTASRAAERRPGEEGWTPVLRPLAAVMWADARRAYVLLLTAALLLLGLIVANVSNLLLARSEARRQEFAIRVTLGAGRGAIVRQLLTEGLALALAAGALAFTWCVWLRHLLVSRFPEVTDLQIDGRVFGFALLVSVLVGLAFGFLPAHAVLGREPGGTLQEHAGMDAPRRRTGRVLAVVQLGAAAALLMCCGLLVRSAFGIRAMEPGFDTARLLTASVSLPEPTYPPERREAFYRELANRVAAVPGVTSVGLTSRLPLDEGVTTLRVDVEGRPLTGEDAMRASRKTIDEGYLATVGVQVLAGENPGRRDPGAVMINRTLAGVLWKGDLQAAVGARIRIDRGPWLRVAAVVSDVRQILTMPPAPEIYVPLWPAPPSAMSLVIRTAGGPEAVAPHVAGAVQALDIDVPVSNVWTMETIVNGYFPAPIAAAFAGLSVAALLLSALGLYAIVAFQVTRRTREFGIRIALGADANRLRRAIVGEGLRLTAAGLVPGAVAGSGLGYVLSSQLGATAVVDPLVTAIVATLLTAVSAAACLVPGLRVTRIQPAVALRCE